MTRLGNPSSNMQQHRRWRGLIGLCDHHRPLRNLFRMDSSRRCRAAPVSCVWSIRVTAAERDSSGVPPPSRPTQGSGNWGNDSGKLPLWDAGREPKRSSSGVWASLLQGEFAVAPGKEKKSKLSLVSENSITRWENDSIRCRGKSQNYRDKEPFECGLGKCKKIIV